MCIGVSGAELPELFVVEDKSIVKQGRVPAFLRHLKAWWKVRESRLVTKDLVNHVRQDIIEGRMHR